MNTSLELATIIIEHRKLTEARLARLLKKAGLEDETSHSIQFSILDYHHTRFDSFLSQMSEMLKRAPRRVDRGTIKLVMQDAWNYFPHASLRGKCPAELALSALERAR